MNLKSIGIFIFNIILGILLFISVAAAYSLHQYWQDPFQGSSTKLHEFIEGDLSSFLVENDTIHFQVLNTDEEITEVEIDLQTINSNNIATISANETAAISLDEIRSKNVDLVQVKNQYPDAVRFNPIDRMNLLPELQKTIRVSVQLEKNFNSVLGPYKVNSLILFQNE